MLALLNLQLADANARFLQGTSRTLGAFAPENQVLLNLENLPIQDTFATAGQALTQNDQVHKQLIKMTSQPYFSTYKVDLSDAKCPFEDDTATCANRQCAIEPLSSKDIDEMLFKSQFLGRLRKDSVSKEAPSGDAEDCAPAAGSLYAFDSSKNYCYPEDESEEADGVWVDLRDNQERFTGYDGAHAHLMWSKVYAENCFGYAGEHENNQGFTGEQQSSLHDAFGQLAEVMAHPRDPEQATDALLPSEDCMEQRVFYRLLSGMHASISTHLSFEWWNTTECEWMPNLSEWLERVGWHEDRLNNLFFDYIVMSRAVSKLANVYERQLLFSSSCQVVDSDVRIMLRRLGRQLQVSPLHDAINEQALFASPEGQALKAEFRKRVRNVNALMSCVGCERCRLWGKIQTAGYGTALKILFELPSNPSDDEETVAEVLSTFRRSELVALINTFGRISHSLYAVKYFFNRSEGILIDQSSFRYQWRLAWQDTMRAFKFIMWSYVELPKNLYKFVLIKASKYWKQLTAGDNMYAEIDLNEGFHLEL